MQRLWFYCDESSVNTGWSEGLVREGLLIATLTKSYKSYTSTMILLPPFARQNGLATMNSLCSLRLPPFFLSPLAHAARGAHWILINKATIDWSSFKTSRERKKTTITTIPRGNNTPPRQGRTISPLKLLKPLKPLKPAAQQQILTINY